MTGHRIILWLILAAALGLRLWGIDFGLPGLYHADEPVVVNHALAYGSGDLNPHFFAIPPFVSYILFLLFAVFYAIGRLSGIFASTQDIALSFLRDPTHFYLIGRIVLGAIWGTATVYVVYLLGKRLFGRRAGLLAALFMAVAFLHVQNSHYIYADIPMVFFVSLTALLSLRIIKTPGWPQYIAAGVCAGLAAGAKYNGALAFILILPSLRRKRDIPKMAVSFLAMAAAFLAVHPFALLDYTSFISGIAAQAKVEYPSGPFYHLSYSLAGGIGLALLVVSLAGLVYGLFKKGRELAGIVSFMVVYYIALIRFSQPHERYALPLVAFLLIFAGLLIDRFFKKDGLRWTVALAVALPTLCASLYSDWLFAGSDTRSTAALWIRQNLPENARIAMEHSFYCPRLRQSRAQIEQKLGLPEAGQANKRKRLEYELLLQPWEKTYNIYYLKQSAALGQGFLFEKPQIAFSMNALAGNSIDYVVYHFDKPSNLDSGFLKELESSFTPVKCFSPYRDQGRRFSDDLVQETGGPFLGKELFARSSTGYTICIFKMNENGR